MTPLDDFMPHGQCFLWKPELVWLHTISDGLIALSYYSIPIALVYFASKRRDLPFNWMFLMFGAFILACGTTHIMGIWTVWNADYWLDGAVKAATAGISLVTAGLLWPLLPKALALPSPSQLEAVNRDLKSEIAERTRVEEEVRALNLSLERRVAERTAEMEAANEKLKTMAQTLEQRVKQRTAELQLMVNAMAGREVRMADLKDVLGRLRAQLRAAGLTPAADDPLCAAEEK